MRAVVESIHAQEHWMRLSAGRAVRFALQMAQTCPPTKNNSTKDALTKLIDRANMALTPELCAESFELSAAYLLRAAVILRREEAGL